MGPPSHVISLDLSSSARYVILINALQDCVNEALDKVEAEGSTTLERDHFQSIADTATELIDELR